MAERDTLEQIRVVANLIEVFGSGNGNESGNDQGLLNDFQIVTHQIV